MKMMLLILALAVCVAETARAQTARFVGESLVISDAGRRITIPNMTVIADHAPIAPCVHAIQKRNSEYFLLVTTSSWTRGYPPRGGYCGSGVEARVDWLHIVAGKVAQADGDCYESCRRNREGHILGWRGSIFTVETEDSEETFDTIRVTFDSRHPEAGIKTEQD